MIYDVLLQKKEGIYLFNYVNLGILIITATAGGVVWAGIFLFQSFKIFRVNDAKKLIFINVPDGSKFFLRGSISSPIKLNYVIVSGREQVLQGGYLEEKTAMCSSLENCSYIVSQNKIKRPLHDIQPKEK